jgi:hypothetical protein
LTLKIKINIGHLLRKEDVITTSKINLTRRPISVKR